MRKLPKITNLLFLCNILQKKEVMKLIFCMQRSMKVSYKSILWLWLEWLSIPISLQYLNHCNISNKKLEMKLIFCIQINIKVDFNNSGIKVFYKVILSFLMGIIKHSQNTQSNKFALSLQYLKKEVRYGVNFLHVDKHQSFYKLTWFWMELARHLQSTQNRKLLIFLQYNKKKVLQLLLCSIVRQSIHLFYGGPVIFVVTCHSSL